jgi:hypothetical protein
MRWLRIGERVHAVTREHGGLTLCGLAVARACRIEHAGNFDERCANCDRRWRDIGRASKPKAGRVDYRTVYRPQYTFADFEAEDDVRRRRDIYVPPLELD